jgi:hypothetical protein
MMNNGRKIVVVFIRARTFTVQILQQSYLGYSSYLPTYEDETDSVFQNAGT